MISKLFCPLLNKEVDDLICFDIHTVIHEGAPKWTAPKEVFEIKGYEKICLNCPNHRED